MARCGLLWGRRRRRPDISKLTDRLASGLTRRQFARGAAGVAGLFAFSPGAALAAPVRRQLWLASPQTGEELSVVYADDAGYRLKAVVQLMRLLRDFRTGEVRFIDPALFDLLFTLREVTGSRAPYEVTSGYRSPATNAMLRARGFAAGRNSLHMSGKAVDVRASDVSAHELRDAALELRLGGVGYYPGSNSVHLDTGRVRRW